MPEQRGTLESVAITLAKLLQPLEERLDAGELRLLFAELGLQFSPAIDTIAGVTAAANNSISTIIQLRELVLALVNAIASKNLGEILAKSTTLVSRVSTAIDNIESLATALKAAGAATGVPIPQLNEFADALPGRLIDYLLVRNLESLPAISEGLELIRALERIEENVGSVDPTRPPYTRRKLHLDRLLNFLESPVGTLQTYYGWGTSAFDGISLLQTIQRILNRANIPAILDTSVSPPVLDVLFVEVSPRTDLNPKGLAIRIADTVRINNAVPFVEDRWRLEFGITNQLSVGTQILLQPNDEIRMIPTTGQVQGETYLQWTGGQPGDTPYLILGQTGTNRLEAGQLRVRAGVGFAWNNTTNQAQGALTINGEIKRGKIVINTSQADGFLGQILSGFALESDFDVGLGFSTREGIFFHGSSTLEIQLPSHIRLGPIEINALTLSVGLQTPLPIALSANLKAVLGPLTALVEQVGFAATLDFPNNQTGNLGPVDLGFGFLPPKGVGLSVDAGVVKGGGYLYFDFDREEYAGALELVFSGFLNLKAIGLITTKMPDGSPGFSLLIIITAEFATGIQLGFGFTLLGVGGLIGLNRTMRLQPLAEGVRTGAINSILFPKDVIANAPRIISDLRTIFPPEEGKFLIGPMAKLGWGTPTLISLSLGVIIEIPGNIAILGVLKVALPTVDAPLLVLQVNFIGAIEFDKKRIWFFASLFESRLLFMTLEGEMGLLVAFGDDANFVVSVGGFHPQFNPPPLPFPSPARIAINYINEPNARIRVMNYFAVTSNTAQLGAHAELFFGFGGFSVQGHMGFDALIQFSPFHFIIEVSASVALKAFGVGVFSISLRFSLEGTSPWRAKGTGSISLFFFDISADFDITWGEERNTTLPPIEVMPILKAEFERIDNWRALLPASNNLLVSLRKLETAADTLVLHPVGVLKISQKAIPLDLPIDKVGNQKSSDAKKLRVAVTSTGLGKKSDAQEQFAIAQFQNMEDASKLSRPAYEFQHGGLELSVAGQQLASSRMVKRVIRYEEIIIDNNFKRFIRHFSIFVGALFNHFMAGASISKSSLSQSYLQKLQPFDAKIAVQPASYAVAFQATNKSIGTTATFTSQASANDYLQQQIAIDPNMSDALHVIPTHEVVSV